MDSKIKKVEIKDSGAIKYFTIRLFNPIEGLDFIDRLISTLAGDMSKISIRPLLKDLLPLATMTSPDGEKIMDLTYDKVNNVFENPLSVLELGIAILEHQMVFMKESEAFRQYLKPVQSMFNMPTSDSATRSAI